MTPRPPTSIQNDYDDPKFRYGQGDGRQPALDYNDGRGQKNDSSDFAEPSSSQSSLQRDSTYSSHNPAMKASDVKDEPFVPPKDTGYLGYVPKRSSSDVEHNPYQSYHPKEHTSAGLDDQQHTPLVATASKSKSNGYYNLDYADPPANKPSGILGKLLANSRYPIEQRIENKRRGIGVQRYPVVVWTLTAIMIGVIVYELVLNGRKQGSPISLKPTINPMLGPSGSVLITLGARFPPCMKPVPDVPLSTSIACLDNTELPGSPNSKMCTVTELCAFGLRSGQEPNQWFRFITAIFLHAGIIHLLLNMLAQMTLSAQIEREMGSSGFLITYFAAGIFGNVLGGNFALVGVPSVGASGAIFGSLAVTWVDLFAHWKYQYRPVRKLIFMTIELAIGVAMGFIPYVDNFAHIGGFVMGLLVGTVFYPVISTSKRHKIVMWGFRLAAIPVAVTLFVVLARNFYTSDPYAACAGCRYLSCIPMAANNYCKGTGLITTTS